MKKSDILFAHNSLPRKSIFRELFESYRAIRQIENIIVSYIIADKDGTSPVVVNLRDIEPGMKHSFMFFCRRFWEYREKAKLFDELQVGKK